MKTSFRSTAGMLAGLLGLAAAAPSALAQPRPIRIEQVMAGAYGHPEIQFIELRADLCSSSWPAAAQLTFLTATGAPAGVFAFPSAPAGGCPGPTSILIGTPAFAALGPAPDPDFLMPPLLAPDSGSVCLEAPGLNFPPCLSYGSFSSSSSPSPRPNAPTLPVHGICALRHNNSIVPLHEMSNLDFDLLPPVPANSAGEAGIVTVPPRFQDVPAASPFQPFVEALFNAGISGGCGAASFCPEALVTREQMAVFLSLAKQGRQFRPPSCTLQLFTDVPCSRPLAPWINDLVARGFSGGCGNGHFCPESPVRRKEMAVFLLLVSEGAGFAPPACAVPAFADVPCSDPFAPWVNELAARGITGGCAPGQFCPDDFVRRDQMAVFLSATFGLPVPTRECRAPLVPDDHGDGIATATPVSTSPDGIGIAGRLERRRDVDFFAFDAQAGDLFTFQYDSGVLPTGFQGSIGILDASGTILGGISLPRLLSFTAPHTGRFFFLMRDAANRSIGDYEISFRGPLQDDVGTGPDEAVPLTLNGPPVAGEIEFPEDVDAYSFEAESGGLYVVETVGSDLAMNSFLAILDPSGNVVSQSGSPFGPRENLILLAPSTGRFRVHVSHGSGGAGTYQIRVRGPLTDDHGNTPATATALAGGDPAAPVDGEILSLEDVDFFSFSGAAGDVFLLKLEDLSAGFVVFQVAVLDADGLVLLEVDDWIGNLDRLAIHLPEAGTRFLRVRRTAMGDLLGKYRLTLTGPVPDDHGDTRATATALTPGAPPTAGVVEVVQDVDFFSFPAQAGELFLVEVSSGTVAPLPLDVFHPDGSPLRRTTNGEWVAFVAPVTGTYFAQVQRWQGSTAVRPYTIQVRGPIVDVGGRPSMSTPLVPDAPPVSSALELPGDVDLYSFPATAGETLLVRAQGPFFLDTFDNVRLELLDTDGLTVLASAASSFEAGIVELGFQAPRTGTFYVRVFAFRTLPYQLSLRGPDDHGNTPATATPLVLGAPPTAGEIELNPDFDLFFVEATAGQVLIVETSGLGGGLDTILDVLTADGLTQLATDDDSAGGLASRIRFVVPSAGRYLVRVRPFGSTAGTYQVSAGEE